MQKLILPINATRITAGYKNANYKKQFGFNHYGIDTTDKNRSNFTVYACGKGTVVACGWDPKLGYTVVIEYKSCQLTNGQVKDLVIRQWHFESINVTKGQLVTKDTKIGIYGNTGEYSSGRHLHTEIDTDTKYPTYSPSIGSNSTIIKAGTDSTINPCLALHVKYTSPDHQSVSNSGYDTVGSIDLQYKTY